MAVVTAEELRILVRAETKAAVENLTRLKKEAKSTSTGVKTMGSTAKRAGPEIGKYGTISKTAAINVKQLAAGLIGPVGVTVAIIAVTRAIKDSISSSIKYAAEVEQISIAFEVLLGSAENAQEVLKDLRDFSVKTPFTFEELAPAAKRLLAFGTEAKDVVDVMRDLGNAAGGNGEILNRLVDAYGKVQAKGRASLEELNRFTEAGVPLMKQLAADLEMTNEELFKFISAGKLGFEEVNKSLQNMTRGEGQFAGMLEEQSKTLNGLMSTLKGSMQELGRDMVSGFIPGIKGVTTVLIDWLDNINEAKASAKEINDLINTGGAGRGTIPYIGAQKAAWYAKQIQLSMDQVAFSGGDAEETIARLAKNLKLSQFIVSEVAIKEGALNEELRNQMQWYKDLVALGDVQDLQITNYLNKQQLSVAEVERIEAITAEIVRLQKEMETIKTKFFPETEQQKIQAAFDTLVEYRELVKSQFVMEPGQNKEDRRVKFSAEFPDVQDMITDLWEMLQALKDAGIPSIEIPITIEKPDTFGFTEGDLSIPGTALSAMVAFYESQSEGAAKVIDMNKEIFNTLKDLEREFSILDKAVDLSFENMVEKAQEAKAEIVDGLLAGIGQAAAGQALDFLWEMGAALQSGANDAASMAAAWRKSVESFMKVLPQYLLQAGLSLMGVADPTGATQAIGLGLVLASGLAALLGPVLTDIIGGKAPSAGRQEVPRPEMADMPRVGTVSSGQQVTINVDGNIFVKDELDGTIAATTLSMASNR